MRYVISVFSVLVISFFMSGCSATGPRFAGFVKPADGTANVYLYRTQFLGAGVTPMIHKKNLDTQQDKEIGSIKPNGYIMTTITPGNYEFWAKTEVKNEVQLSVKADKIYCIENYITMGFIVGHPQFKLVSLDQCEKEIQETKESLQE